MRSLKKIKAEIRKLERKAGSTVDGGTTATRMEREIAKQKAAIERKKSMPHRSKRKAAAPLPKPDGKGKKGKGKKERK